jgi:putative ribosome biogenesis GTPase RsgA
MSAAAFTTHASERCCRGLPGSLAAKLWGDEVRQMTFDEIEILARNCGYRDWPAAGEPGRALLEAVQAGALSIQRLPRLHELTA